MRAGRHPVVEHVLAAERRRLRAERRRCSTRTARASCCSPGPNMSGKSTYLRQVALLVLLAQIGSFVPAESARIGVVDRIFTRVGASDRLAQGESTFMVEMRETAEILAQASRASLVILDEIGRGTSTFDGLSIAWAVAEYLHDTPGLRPRTLFATHYHELADLARDARGRRATRTSRCASGRARWCSCAGSSRGEVSRSYGIEVARLAGLPARGDRARARGARPSSRASATRASAGARAQLTLFEPRARRRGAQEALAALRGARRRSPRRRSTRSRSLARLHERLRAAEADVRRALARSLALAALAAARRSARTGRRDVRADPPLVVSRVHARRDRAVAPHARRSLDRARRRHARAGQPERLYLDLAGLWVGHHLDAPIAGGRRPAARHPRRPVHERHDARGDRSRALRPAPDPHADESRPRADRRVRRARPAGAARSAARGRRAAEPGAGAEPAGRRAAARLRRVQTVVVDAGHGGDDPGAIGPGGLREKDVTLARRARRSRSASARAASAW